VDIDLELVRKGYDPAQVQDLVGTLSNELKALTAENDRLRAQLAEQPPAASSPSAADAEPDVFDHWSNETNALLAAARESIATVHAKAETDAAAVVATAEAEAAEIRHQAQLDAELVIGEATRQAEDTTTAADAHRLATETDMQALQDRTNAQVGEAKAQLADLQQQRAAISQQLGSTKAQLTQLLSLVAAPDDAAPSDHDTAEHADGDPPTTDEPNASAEHADDHA
jgi:cell division septum initiation protein DivIVA